MRNPGFTRGRDAFRPAGSALLLGLGLRELSMGAAAIPEIKEATFRETVRECEDAAEEALRADSAEAVEEIVARRPATRFYDLLSSEAQKMPDDDVPSADFPSDAPSERGREFEGDIESGHDEEHHVAKSRL